MKIANPILSGLLAGSADSRARDRRPPHRLRVRSKGRWRERGVALILAMTCIAILTVVLADMHETTGTSYALATTERDELRAEYLARSAINLTRLLVAQRPAITAAITPLYMGLLQRQPPPIPVWIYANEILQPFCDYDHALDTSAEAGFDFGMAEGLGDTGGRCEILAFAENARINVNMPPRLFFGGEAAQLNAARLVYQMTGGNMPSSQYDPLFERRDPDGQITTRLDIISALIDWWDLDTQRTNYDPGAGTMTSSGAEDDIYSRFRDPYQVKNAPFDSIEELRLIRGVGDDFWSTFLEPDPDNPQSRLITIYGSGAVNPNEAMPEVLLNRTCSFPGAVSPLCDDPAEQQKFLTVLYFVKQFAPLPWFSGAPNFLAFLEGQGGAGELYPTLAMLAPQMLFRPNTINPAIRQQLQAAFVADAQIITVQATGLVGNCDEESDQPGPGRCTRVTIRTVLNFHQAWTPPPPNAGMMPRTGIFYYWRIE